MHSSEEHRKATVERVWCRLVNPSRSVFHDTHRMLYQSSSSRNSKHLAISDEREARRKQEILRIDLQHVYTPLCVCMYVDVHICVYIMYASWCVQMYMQIYVYIGKTDGDDCHILLKREIYKTSAVCLKKTYRTHLLTDSVSVVRLFNIMMISSAILNSSSFWRHSCICVVVSSLGLSLYRYRIGLCHSVLPSVLAPSPCPSLVVPFFFHFVVGVLIYCLETIYALSNLSVTWLWLSASLDLASPIRDSGYLPDFG